MEKSTVDGRYVQSIIDQLGVCPVDFEDMLRGCCTVTARALRVPGWKCLRKCKDDDKISTSVSIIPVQAVNSTDV
jgi:hypothetical protein